MRALIVESSQSPAHTPAWKKLGLQLNTDKGTTPHVVTERQPQSAEVGKKRHRSDVNKPLPAKKRLLFSSGANGDDGEMTEMLQNAEESATELPTTVPSTKQNALKNAPPDSTPRKSVSFTVGQKNGEPDRSDPELPSERDVGPSAADKKKAEKKLKGADRSTSRSTPNSASSPSTTVSFPAPTKTDSLHTYLTVFSKCRGQWKFQKNRETQLLKHALSLDRIPAAENAALGIYLANLKNEAAKRRISAAAMEVIQRDEEDINAPQEKTNGKDNVSVARKVYQNAITLFKMQLAGRRGILDSGDEGEKPPENLNLAWLERLEKRRRAELVLFFTGAQAGGERGSAPTGKRAGSSRKKKRKNRTAVVLDETNSSSSSDSKGKGEDAL